MNIVGGVYAVAGGPAVTAVGAVPAPTTGLPAAPGARPPGWSSLGTVTDPRLDEISGVIASRAHPGTLWVHNDSGDSARVFALAQDGSTLAEVTVDGATAVDWEDIAFGPGPAGSKGDWIYVSDTGNNKLLRGELSIYRFAEPSPAADTHVRAERLDIRFDDNGRHNIEALFVDPRSGDMVLVTKSRVFSEAKVFRVPARAFGGGTAVAQTIGTIDIGRAVTGADISADGSQIAIRTYDDVALWRRNGTESIAQALARTPLVTQAPRSEAIAFSPDGSRWFSIAEGRNSSVDTREVPALAALRAA